MNSLVLTTKLEIDAGGHMAASGELEDLAGHGQVVAHGFLHKDGGVFGQLPQDGQQLRAGYGDIEDDGPRAAVEHIFGGKVDQRDIESLCRMHGLIPVDIIDTGNPKAGKFVRREMSVVDDAPRADDNDRLRMTRERAVGVDDHTLIGFMLSQLVLC